MNHRIGVNLGNRKENCLTLGCVAKTEYSMKKWMKLEVVLHKYKEIFQIMNGIMGRDEWIRE